MKLALGVVFVASCSQAQVVSTFDADVDGWGTANDARGFQWESAIEGRAGVISADDVGDGRIWYFSAADAFLGNQSGAFGGTLTYDIFGVRGSQTSVTQRADVILIGANGDAIGIDEPGRPVFDAWTTLSYTLDASSNWRVVNSLANGTLTNTAASDQQIAAILGDLDALWIQGEYTNGSDSTALDRVELIPAPASAALLAAGALIVHRRRD